MNITNPTTKSHHKGIKRWNKLVLQELKENSEQDFEKVLNRNEIYDIEI